MQNRILSMHSASPIENTTTKALDVAFSALSALPVSIIKASGSGPRYDVVTSSGMNSTKILSWKASDRSVRISRWTSGIDTPTEVTSSLLVSIAHSFASGSTGSHSAEKWRENVHMLIRITRLEQGQIHWP